MCNQKWQNFPGNPNIMIIIKRLLLNLNRTITEQTATTATTTTVPTASTTTTSNTPTTTMTSISTTTTTTTTSITTTTLPVPTNMSTSDSQGTDFVTMFMRNHGSGNTILTLTFINSNPDTNATVMTVGKYYNTNLDQMTDFSDTSIVANQGFVSVCFIMRNLRLVGI